MAKLTEDMVTARARGADITTLRKLNCWGASLTDVSLLLQMRNLEVIAFSVNQISSLGDFVNCTRLKELYLRDNRIADVNELCYLQELPSLRHLWLKENPIERLSDYRLVVLRALPWLEKLDDQLVSEAELDEARRLGSGQLVRPDEREADSPSPIGRDYEEASSSDEQPQCEPPSNRSDFYDRDRGNESSGYSSARKAYDEAEDEQSYERQPVRPAQLERSASAQRLAIGSVANHRSARNSIRSSNILSSVLLLIKELDLASLEVVHIAVQSRINEMIED